MRKNLNFCFIDGTTVQSYEIAQKLLKCLCGFPAKHGDLSGKSKLFFQQKYKIILIVQNWLSLRQKRDQTLEALFKVIILIENTNTIIALDKKLVKPPIKSWQIKLVQKRQAIGTISLLKVILGIALHQWCCTMWKAITVTYVLADNLLLLLDKANSSICIAHEEMPGPAFVSFITKTRFCKLYYQGEIF